HFAGSSVIGHLSHLRPTKFSQNAPRNPSARQHAGLCTARSGGRSCSSDCVWVVRDGRCTQCDYEGWRRRVLSSGCSGSKLIRVEAFAKRNRDQEALALAAAQEEEKIAARAEAAQSASRPGSS
ncbi:hypothetical protein DACRYDRAFT_97487, partial [Dacryopinax primogenitus]